jgi:serine/threonine-protein kinase RsbW
VETENNPAYVELKIPCRPEYVGVARLAILGIASRMKFYYDEVEDVRLAVGEACTTSVDWAQRNNKSDTYINLKSHITPEKLTVEIIDQAGPHNPELVDNVSEPENIGALLVTLLVDEVEMTSDETGTRVRMVKYARQR